MHILARCGQHQLDPVQLVDFAGPRIVVDGYDVGLRVPPAQFFDHAFSHHMVGQAGEGLGADDVGRAAVDQLQHLPGEEPSLPGLVANGYDGAGHLGQVCYLGGWGEVAALFERLVGCAADMVDPPDRHVGHPRCALFRSQVFGLEVLVVKAVTHKVDQVRHHRLRAFLFQKFRQVIVGGGEEFDQDLTHDAHPRFSLMGDRDLIEIPDHHPADLLKYRVAAVSVGEETDAAFFPFPVHPVDGAFL